MPTLLLINGKSGAVLRAGVDHCRALIAEHCRDEIVEVVGTPADLIAAAGKAVADPAIARVLLIGGDGTAAAVAGELGGSGKIFVPLPGGTMNMLARDLGFSGELETAIAELDRAFEAKIDIGCVGSLTFLNNVVFGTFSVAAESREAMRDAETLAETASATADFISAVVQTDARDYTITIDGQPETVRTNTLMVANNLYTGSETLRPTRQDLDRGVLAVYIAEAEGAFDFLSVIYDAVSGQLGEAESVRLRQCTHCLVHGGGGLLNVTVDGEVMELNSPAEFTIRPQALTVLRMPDVPRA